jgi:hypothetical protein
MRKCISLLVLVGLAACDLSQEPELREQSNELELLSEWSASIGGVGSSTITGTTSVRVYGSYSEAEISISGALPSRSYQWRIFRGSCAATAAADLGLHATIQSYPDLVTNAAGSASTSRLLGGALNSPAGLYSVRLRLAVSATNWNGTSPLACGDLTRS